MKASEVVFITGLSIFSGLILYNSLEMPYMSEHSFGPGFIPLNISILILLFCGVQFFFAYFNHIKELSKEDGFVSKIKDSIPYPVIFLIFIMVLTAFAMDMGSVLIPLWVLVLLVSKVLLKNNLTKSIISSSLIILAIYLIFGAWLNIPLR